MSPRTPRVAGEPDRRYSLGLDLAISALKGRADLMRGGPRLAEVRACIALLEQMHPDLPPRGASR